MRTKEEIRNSIKINTLLYIINKLSVIFITGISIIVSIINFSPILLLTFLFLFIIWFWTTT